MIELADIFREYGPAYLEQYGGRMPQTATRAAMRTMRAAPNLRSLHMTRKIILFCVTGELRPDPGMIRLLTTDSCNPLKQLLSKNAPNLTAHMLSREVTPTTGLNCLS